MKKIVFSFSIITAMAVAAMGMTYAVFSDTEDIQGNTLSTATVDIDLRALDSGEIDKPLDLEGFVPGQQSDWARAEIYNTTPSTTVDLYMYVANVSGDACNRVNLEVTTGHAGSNAGEQAEEVYNGRLLDLRGPGNRVQVNNAASPFSDGVPSNTTQVIQQRAELDESAGNNYQNTSCEWDEVFVAENVDPDPTL